MDLTDSARRMEVLYYHGLKERKCARLTSEEKNHETIRIGE